MLSDLPRGNPKVVQQRPPTRQGVLAAADLHHRIGDPLFDHVRIVELEDAQGVLARTREEAGCVGGRAFGAVQYVVIEDQRVRSDALEQEAGHLASLAPDEAVRVLLVDRWFQPDEVTDLGALAGSDKDESTLGIGEAGAGGKGNAAGTEEGSSPPSSAATFRAPAWRLRARL